MTAVFAHPDDESIFVGGTLAACAAAGIEVGVISLTRGELGGQRRGRELQAAAGELGIAWAECLDYPDGEVAHARGTVEALSLRLLDAAPAAVISFGEEGLYWHPDHIATHAIARSAIEALDPPVRFYAAVWPLGLMTRLVAAAAERGLGTDLWGMEPDAFGVPPGTIALELDVTRFLDAKLRAIGRHSSQIAWGHVLHELPPDLAREYLGYEYFSGDDAEWLAGVVARA